MLIDDGEGGAGSRGPDIVMKSQPEPNAFRCNVVAF
jgi:hypothetical protein